MCNCGPPHFEIESSKNGPHWEKTIAFIFSIPFNAETYSYL